MRARLLSLLGMFLLAACGGGGGGNGGNGGGNNPPPVAAPTNLSYSNPPALVVSQQMAALSPTVTGAVTSYSVTPALPAGLAINATSGVISGTPTAATATATYTVTATNASGSTTAGVSMTVNAAPPATPVISYDSESYSFTTGLPATPAAPVNSGGAVASWSIAPALPAGLTFSTTDGSITGTPEVESAAATYSITAQNASGSDTVELSITVDSGVLMELGHDNQMVSIRRSGTRVLSIDYLGHWVLWNAANTAILARGDVTCEGAACVPLVDLAGSTLAVRVGTGLQVRDAADGHLIANIATTSNWWKLASDGSYVAAATATEVTAWSRTGSQLFTKPGNYAPAKAFAAASELRLAAGPAGANTLETIVVSTGASSTAPFSGGFHSWFLDGDRFLTILNSTVWVYDADATQLDLQTIPAFLQLVGQGNYFWTRSNTTPQLKIYEVGSSATPAASFPLSASTSYYPAGDTIGLFDLSFDFSIVDLSGATPVKLDHSQPLSGVSAYYANASGEWLIGNQWGVIVGATATPSSTRYFGYGKATSIVANTARIAVATAAGKVFYFDGVTSEPEGEIDFSTSKVRMSADGTVLAAAASGRDIAYENDVTLKIFSMPSEAVLREDPYEQYVVPYLLDFSLADSGQVFGRVLKMATVNRTEVLPVGGGPVIWSEEISNLVNDAPVSIYLSPDGSLIAAPDGTGIPDTTQDVITRIIANGVLSSAVPGIAAGWIDDNQLLVNRYAIVPPDTHFARYVGSDIIGANGQLIRSVDLRSGISRFQTVAADRIYSPSQNRILSLMDGETLWSSPNATNGQGGVTATHVIFGSRGSVRAEPY